MKHNITRSWIKGNNTFLTLANYTNNIVICLSLDLNILEFNPSAEQWYERPRREVLGTNYQKLCETSRYESPLPTDYDSILSGKPFKTEQRYAKDIKLSWTITSLLDLQKSKAYGLLLIGEKTFQQTKGRLEEDDLAFLARQVKEVTGQEPDKYTTAKDYVHNIRAYYEKIISCMPNNVYWLNRNCITLGCNDNVVKFIGLKSQKEFIGIDYEKMGKLAGWAGGIAESFKKDDMQVMDTKIPIFNKEEPAIADKHGNPTYYISSRVPLRDDSDKIIGIVGISTDITERKTMEQDLIKTKEQAELANQLKSEFIANMEHDIRTPAGGIVEMAKMLAAKEQDHKKYENLIYLAEAGKQLLDLLNNILAFDHVESGNIPLIDKKFNIKELIYELLSLEKPAAQLKNLQLLFEFSKETPMELIGDDHRLRRILLNLLSNAIKFTDKGHIKLMVEPIVTKDDKICLLKISIQDTGRGISLAEQHLIYEKFSRGTPANKGLYRGMGLGLRIVKQFIEDMDGEIEVKSKVGSGTTFICTIPFQIPLTSRLAISKPEEPKEQEKIEVTAVKTKRPKLKILLVEDNALAQMIASNMLQDEFEAKVDAANTGKEALHHASSAKYDLIFMDIGLPDTTGYEVTKEIRKGKNKNKNTITPIVALTAHRVDMVGNEASTSGMNDFLTKPLNSEKTQKVLDKLIYQKSEAVFGEAAKTSEKPEQKIDKQILSLSAATKIFGKRETAEKVIQMFIDMIPEHEEEIDDAFHNKDYRALVEAAHKLIGSTCYTGTPKLKRTSEDLKKACINKKIGAIKGLVDRVHNELDEVIDAYKNLT